MNTMALSGDTSDGFSTIVQPAASAGATLHATWFIGQFHGVIKAHTPIGSRTSNVEPTCLSNSKSARAARMVAKWASRLRPGRAGPAPPGRPSRG